MTLFRLRLLLLKGGSGLTGSLKVGDVRDLFGLFERETSLTIILFSIYAPSTRRGEAWAIATKLYLRQSIMKQSDFQDIESGD